MKKKTKKILFTIILISLISLFIYLKNRSYDYERIYNVDQFKIIEEYTKFESSYNFTIKYDNLTYPYKIYKKFLKEKELIEKIEVYKNDEETCILPYSTKLDFYPICNNEKEIYNYNISSIKVDEFKYPEIKRLNKNYENIKIKSYNDNNFLIYNYKGFYYLSNDESKNIQLFEKDIYSLQLIYQLDEYILIADYNEEYYFDKFQLLY